MTEIVIKTQYTCYMTNVKIQDCNKYKTYGVYYTVTFTNSESRQLPHIDRDGTYLLEIKNYKNIAVCGNL